jgi:hypothetical protein
VDRAGQYHEVVRLVVLGDPAVVIQDGVEVVVARNG